MNLFLIAIAFTTVVGAWIPSVPRSQEDECYSFTQVGEKYNTTGKPQIYPYWVECPSSPNNDRCNFNRTLYMSINATVNFTTSSADNILESISNATNSSFLPVYGIIDNKISGYDEAFVPAGEKDFFTLAPNMTCIDGALQACDDGESPIAVQACAPVAHQISNNDFTSDVWGTIEVKAAPSTTPDVLANVPTNSLLALVPWPSSTRSAQKGTATRVGYGLYLHVAGLLVGIAGVL